MSEKNLVICRGYVPNYIESKKLLFYHIPKSAGTSICNILSCVRLVNAESARTRLKQGKAQP